MWLIWSTPYQIAGGRIGLDGTIAWVNVDGPPLDGFQNGLTEATIKWNLQNGFNVGLGAGVWWGSDSALAEKDSRFMGQADVAYIHGGWQFSANTFWGFKDSSSARPATSTMTWPLFARSARCRSAPWLRLDGSRRCEEAEPVRSRRPRGLRLRQLLRQLQADPRRL